jgi:hypothetical protein
MKWITREYVKADRVACPWLIKKFVDKDAEFVFVPADNVMDEAKRLGAIPYDVKDVELGHHGKECSFEAIVKKYNLTGDRALVLLGRIVNGADTDNTLYQQPEGPGLNAIAEGFRHLWLQGRPCHQWGGVDHLRRSLRLLPKDGARRQTDRLLYLTAEVSVVEGSTALQAGVALQQSSGAHVAHGSCVTSAAGPNGGA